MSKSYASHAESSHGSLKKMIRPLFHFIIAGIQLYGFWKLRSYHYQTANTVRSLENAVNYGVAHIEDSLRVTADLGLKRSLPAMRDWAAGPDFLLEAIYHVKTEVPAVIVECGSGVSTIVLARCVQRNGIGHVYSFEHLPDHAERIRQELAEQGLTEFATVLTTPLIEHAINNDRWLWYDFESLPQRNIDLLVIDGPPGNTCRLARYPAGPLMFKYLSPCAAVFLDDAHRSDECEILKRWSKEFPVYEQQVRATRRGCAVLKKKPQEEDAAMQRTIAAA